MRRRKSAPAPAATAPDDASNDDSEPAIRANDLPVDEGDEGGEAGPEPVAMFDAKAQGYPTVFADLVAQQSPVRDQGAKSTCTVFSTVALTEYFAIRAGAKNPDFSEEYLFWLAKTKYASDLGSKLNSPFSKTLVNLKALYEDGVIPASVWPYQRSYWHAADDSGCTGLAMPVRCYTNGSPPAAAASAPKHRVEIRP